MQLQAFVPFVTYPVANPDGIATQVVSLASELGAAIHALAINVDIPDVSNALSRVLLDTSTMIRQAEEASRDRGEHLLAAVNTKASAAGVNATADRLAVPLALLSDTAAMHARYFDLSLVGLEASHPTSRMTAEAVVFGSGRPTILLPERSTVGTINHIAIAWDGSRVAARAVADARFVLERAERVSILTVLDEKPLRDKDAGDRLVEALGRHGLKAEAARVNAEDCPIAETLQRSAIERGCKLLVMGGYGHSRVRDFVLGGATQGVLNDPLLPVLLSH
jgi:nucleotide-binding universal stress UspA family protein